MSETFFMFGRFLAQTQSSGLGEFLQQISGLLIGTCVAGAIWVVLMLLVMQRARERRRRERLGLEPLPGFWVTLARRARALLAPNADTTAAQNPDELPAPELDALTGGLPEPALDDLLGGDAPEPPAEPTPGPPPARPEPVRAVPAEPPVAHVVDAPQAAETAEERMSVPPVKEAPMPTDPPNSQDVVEVLRVFRDISDGTLIVEISGQRFTSLAELRTAALERRFLRVLEEMQHFSASPRLTSRPAAPPTTTETPETTEPNAPDDEDLPSLALGSMFRQMRRAAMGQAPQPNEPPPQLSIADEIEALLQEKLTALPAFHERAIHVTASPSGGVRIQVDERFYEGVDEIEEKDVRLLLQEVVSEWQQRL